MAQLIEGAARRGCRVCGKAPGDSIAKHKDCYTEAQVTAVTVKVTLAPHVPRFVLCQSIRQRPPETGAQKSGLRGVPRA
jgi:hypothetical protein